jgi:serine/threonine protein kinase
MAEFEPKQFGKFFLLDKLAVGGMAEIYKAKTFGAEGFEKLLAIKRILPHCAADKDFISMLIDEAKLSVLLSHANIVQVYDLGKVGDDFFISMEYISGVNLRDLVYRCRELGKTIPTDIAVYILSEICKGLDYAHRKTDMNGQPLNLVHRDISPQNILISYEGEVKIVDFGIAKAAMNISHTMAGILKGKIAYMSPEQALGKSVDHRTDIFSVGILLYECLTGEKLFTGESQFEVLKKIRSTKIDLARLPVSIPKPLQVILARALAYFPKDRFQSAGDMQIELTKYLYSTYHDFSPQKLAGFVREVFSTQIAQQRERAQSVVLRESKTGSISLAQEALQEEIVHRDDMAAKSMRTPLPKPHIEPIVLEPTDRTERQSVLWRIGIAGSALLILASLGFIYWQILHPRLFPPVTLTAPILGEATVDSSPQGAQIMIDGTDTGKVTPARLTDLQIGKSYTLKLAKPGYSDAEQPLVATSAQTPAAVTVTLVESRGTLLLTTTPPGAEILIDGAPTGKLTPDSIANLTLGTNHRLVLRKDGYSDYEQVFNLSSDKPQTLDIALQATPLVAQPVPPVTPPVTPQPPVTPPPPNVGETAKQPTPPPEEKKTQAPVKQSTVTFTSTPSGAKVIVDGKSIGTTPAKLPQVDMGSTHTVSIEKQGFAPYRRKFTVSSEKGTTVSATLKEELTAAEQQAKEAQLQKEKEQKQKELEQKQKEKEKLAQQQQQTPQIPKEKPAATGGVGTIKVNSDPSGAEVYVNGEMRGTAPITVNNVPSGAVKIILNKEGLARQSTSVSLAPGETKNLGTIKLGEVYGEVSVNSNPPRATVLLDGTPYGTTPLNIRKVKRDRPHQIRVTLDGYQTWETSFSFGDDKVKKFNVSLESK